MSFFTTKNKINFYFDDFYNIFWSHKSTVKNMITVNTVKDVPACCGALFIHYDRQNQLFNLIKDEEDYINFTIKLLIELDVYRADECDQYDDGYNVKLWMMRFNESVMGSSVLNKILKGLPTMYKGRTNDGLVLIERQECIIYNDDDE